MDDLEILQKRNFYLALSITNGQELAQMSGFSVPSEDVQKHEIMDNISKWLVLHNFGILEEVHKCADWVMETTQKVHEYSEEQAEASRVYITCFAIALLIHLFDNKHIDITALKDLDDLDIESLRKYILGDNDGI